MSDIEFAPFRLDLAGELLWRETQPVALRPKAFAILRYLAENAGRLVTKEELLNTVWPEILVVEAVLKVRIRELREALGDDAKAPRFIETVHRRGYRFIASLTTTQPGGSSQYPVVSKSPLADLPQLTTENRELTPRLVGRDAELERLEALLAKAMTGQRQVVFVTGDPGIGKTMLVDAFLARVESAPTVLSAR